MTLPSAEGLPWSNSKEKPKMLAFPGQIAKAALDAGMKVPTDLDGDIDAGEYPHFTVYCNVQLNRPIRWGEHWDNAKVVAAIPDDKIRTVTLEDLIQAGLEWH